MTGFGTAIAAGCLHIWYPFGVLAALKLAGEALVLLAIAIYLFDVVRIYRGRRRREIELHNKSAAGAFTALGAAGLLAVGSIAAGRFATQAPLIVFLALFGWLGGLGLTQLYKIVPFLTWLGRFGASLGRGSVPRVQDLVDERRAAPWFLVYFVGIALAAAALAGLGSVLFHTGMAFALTATFALSREYWLAWRCGYVDRGVHSPPLPPFMKQEGMSHD
jgi:hypothetical protein